MAVRLDDKLLEFFKRPLMCIIAAASAAGRPSVGRGVGFDVLDDKETLDVVFSAWQWPRLEADIRRRGGSPPLSSALRTMSASSSRERHLAGHGGA
ncbi:pyridoxamine 5'-phosphate oxidase family protein [Ancylobacter oerskovii]|uniref:Pyridoxamine 5'-phosphate oxidase family protein n=1 Tax=Ancylobacter oerskovii TaxID=459519 RepID=A0ABW4Z6E1_9HYPH